MNCNFKYITMKPFLSVILLVGLSVIKVIGQNNVGINATGSNPNSSAGLDVDFTDKGVLIPRVALTQTTSNAPIGASVVTSLLVYNTATVNDVTPGYYYWNGTKWVQLLTSSQGCTSCTTAGWNLVAVANSTLAGTPGWVSSGYTVAAGKEVLVVIQGAGSDINATTSDAVSLAEYNQGNYTTMGQVHSFFISSPFGTNSSGYGSGTSCYSAKIQGRKLGGPNSTVPVMISTPAWSAPYIPGYGHL